MAAGDKAKMEATRGSTFQPNIKVPKFVIPPLPTRIIAICPEMVQWHAQLQIAADKYTQEFGVSVNKPPF